MVFKAEENAFEARKKMMSNTVPTVTPTKSKTTKPELTKVGKSETSKLYKSPDSKVLIDTKATTVDSVPSFSIKPTEKVHRNKVFSIALPFDLKLALDDHIRSEGWKSRNDFFNDLIEAYLENLKSS